LLANLLQAKLESPGRESLLEYFERKLFVPIGARQITPEFDAAGTFLAGHATFAGAEDLARIGMLFLNDGTVKGHRVLPEGWVDYSLRPALAAVPNYGALLMTDAAGLPGCFGHEGVGTQWLIVCPKRSMVMVWFGSDFNFTLAGWTEARGVMRKIYDAIPEKATAVK
jgi:CubicO group peptidase (beta-lactamase class C family)